MKKNIPAWAAAGCGAILILIGIAQKQPAQVLSKAIRVCMECVGIG